MAIDYRGLALAAEKEEEILREAKLKYDSIALDKSERNKALGNIKALDKALHEANKDALNFITTEKHASWFRRVKKGAQANLQS